MSFRLLPVAQRDLLDIDDYLVGSFGLEVATRTQRELQETFRLLAQYQHMGIVRPDLTARPIRFFSHPPYWIAYRPATPLRIYRVYHAKQDLRRMQLPR